MTIMEANILPNITSVKLIPNTFTYLSVNKSLNNFGPFIYSGFN